MNLLREYISALLAEQTGEPRRMPLDIPVPDDLRDIHKMMKGAGMQLFIVGGAVRDTLMDKVPKDYDLATDAQPEAVIDLLRQDPDLRIDLDWQGVWRCACQDACGRGIRNRHVSYRCRKGSSS